MSPSLTVGAVSTFSSILELAIVEVNTNQTGVDVSIVDLPTTYKLTFMSQNARIRRRASETRLTVLAHVFGSHLSMVHFTHNTTFALSRNLAGLVKGTGEGDR
jgi:hypothetical protein